MKILLFVVFSLFLALVCGVFVPPRRAVQKKQHLLGEKECTYGPSYWCQNLTNAADCRATKHCIQTVWIHKQYPEDHTSICDTCKEMVKQARDQLESNETQELIKEVFEGSCALLHLQPVVKECDKIADEYIPDLIDTLASQMNPQVVCAVAGLCNNPKFQKLLAEQGEQEDQVSIKPSEVSPRNRCDDCNTVLDIVVSKFNSMSRDDFLEGLLEFCGRMGSFSDSCSNIVIKHFSDIYSYIKENFNADDFCLLSGECYANFHKHSVEITPMSKIGYVPVDKKDDLPCELCEQLVKHLRDVLIANTTESEFKQVLEGICKQTKSFKDECLGFVGQYYNLIYQYLVDGLNATAVCKMIKICPVNYQVRPIIAPLLPVETADMALKLSQEPEHIYIPKEDVVVRVMQPKQENPILSAQDMQLPIDLLVPPHQQVYNQQSCIFCEYFLHYVQKAISNPKVEDDIKTIIDKACSKLPRSVNETCVEFVNTYEPALVAILAQEIDPSQVCPMIKACPSEKAKDTVDIFANAKASSKCPLCLYAVTELEDMIKNDKTRSNIKAALEKVCSHLPGNLKPECNDFIETYSDELIEMLVADFKPQEVCVYLKLCTDDAPVVEVNIVEKEITIGDTETNAIYDDTVDGHPVENLGDEKCILCEFVMKEIDDQLKDKKTDDDIKHVVYTICSALPGTIKSDCNNFVDQYADAVIILLQEAMEPQSICAYMKLCKRQQHPLEFVREEVSNCAVCRTAADIIKTILQNPKVDQNANHIFKKACRGMPSEMRETCFKTFLKDGRPDYHYIAKVMKQIDDDKRVVLHEKTKNLKVGECIICRLVVKAIKEITHHQHVTIDEVRNILKTICQSVLFLFRGPCDDFVRQYFDKIAKLVIDVVDEEKICSLIMVCEANSVGFNKPKQIGKNDVNVYLENDNINHPDVTDVTFFECPICRAVVKVTKEIVKHSFTRETVRKALKKACSRALVLKSKCHEFVDKFFDRIVELLVSASSRGKVCRLLLICAEEPVNPRTTLENYFSELDKDSCLPCKTVANLQKMVLESANISDALRNGVMSVCDLFPYPIQELCHVELKTYLNNWADMLRNINGEQVCKNGNICTSWNLLTDQNDYEKENCGLCRIAASVMKSIAENPDMSCMLSRGIFQLCELMPYPLKTVCHSELRTHWRDWLNLLKKFNAERFCRNSGLCSAWNKLQNNDINAGKESCGPCRIGASIMKSVVQNPEMSKMLYRGVFQLCDLMPEPLLKTVCHSELRTHWRDWLILLRKFNAERFCRNTGLCSIWYKIQNSGIDAGKESCGPCRIGASIMKSVVQNPEMSKMLYRGVFQLCDLMPEPLLKTVCHSELRTHWRDWVILLRKFNAERFCKNTGLCSIWNKIQNTGIIGGKGSCGSCRIAASIMKSVAENPDMSKMLYQGIFRLCDLMPEPLKTVCHSEQRTHWRDWLFQVCKFNAERFCRYTGLCYTGNKIQITGINADIEIQMPERSEVASVIKAAVEHPLVEVDIESMLRMHCEEMVTGEQRISCLNAVNEHGKIGIEYVIKTVKEFDDEQFLSKGNNLGGKKRCTSCKLIISTMRKVFKSEWSREEVKHHLVEACDYLVLVAGTCKSLVEKYSDRLIRMIGNHVNSAEICRQIHLCKKAEPSYNDIYDEIVRSPNADTQVDSNNCSVCLQSCSMVKENMGKSMEPLSHVLTGICHGFSENYKKLCLNVVNEHGKNGIEYLMKSVRQFDDEQMYLSKENNLGEKKRCISCKLIISTIRKVFKSEWSRNEVKQHLVEACDYLVLVAGTCKSLVEKYSDRLIRMIGNHVNSAEICRQINLCEKAELYYDAIYNETFRNPIEDTQIDSNNCSVCLQYCSMGKENMGKSVAPSSHVLSGICHGVSENYKKLCLDAVNEHGKNGIEYLIKTVREFDDEQMYLSKENNLGEKKRCISCKLIISTIRKVFKSEWSREEVKRHLVEACDYLVLVAGTCKSLVEKYSDRLIRMIGNHVNSAEICRQISLCEKAELSYNDIYNEILRSPNGDTQIDSNSCSVCLQYCSMVKENMGKSMERLSNLLSGICHGVSEKYTKVCLDDIKNYVREWMNNFNKINCQSYCEKEKKCQ